LLLSWTLTPVNVTPISKLTCKDLLKSNNLAYLGAASLTMERVLLR